jgi:alpha-D-ribose 1-methylphosphonate 5-triphosphate diphosphatase
LVDRGRLAPGLRGDVVVVDPAVPAPVAVFAQGRLGWIAPGAVGRLRT